MCVFSGFLSLLGCDEEALDAVQNLFGNFQLRQMTRSWQCLEPCFRHRRREGFAPFEWDPRIVLPSENSRRAS